jgi:agmatinase
VAPQYDATTNTAHVAGQVLFELLCLATTPQAGSVQRPR